MKLYFNRNIKYVLTTTLVGGSLIFIYKNYKTLVNLLHKNKLLKK